MAPIQRTQGLAFKSFVLEVLHQESLVSDLLSCGLGLNEILTFPVRTQR